EGEGKLDRRPSRTSAADRSQWLTRKGHTPAYQSAAARAPLLSRKPPQTAVGHAPGLLREHLLRGGGVHGAGPSLVIGQHEIEGWTSGRGAPRCGVIGQHEVEGGLSVEVRRDAVGDARVQYGQTRPVHALPMMV